MLLRRSILSLACEYVKTITNQGSCFSRIDDLVNIAKPCCDIRICKSLFGNVNEK